MQMLDRPIRILLVKPYEPATYLVMQPPLGILYLISSLRLALGDRVDVAYRDLRLHQELPEAFAAQIAGRYDLVGISALNHEADATHRLTRALKTASPETIVVVGGPYARSEPDRVIASGVVDWVFRGESDRTFPRAVQEWFFGRRDLSGIPGVSWRSGVGSEFAVNAGEDSIEDLDALPLPAWDLVPFDIYARRLNMASSLRAKRYAPIFTSRGCPYRCHYCHDLFGKGFRWRSAENVMREIELLTDRYRVGEFQIVDDIYNLHKPRMREIARKVIDRYGRRSLFFSFPNGVRADIIDVDDLPLLRDMGVYFMSVAIETVIPRLQKLIDKNLDVARAERAINAAEKAGILTRGYFMLGFPTETPEEMEQTVRFALDSKLSLAAFFFVVPQKGTPLYDLAQREAPGVVEKIDLRDYYIERPWYQLAYGVDMARIARSAVFRFHFTPARILGHIRRTDSMHLIRTAWFFFKIGVLRGFVQTKPDASRQPLAHPPRLPAAPSASAGPIS